MAIARKYENFSKWTGWCWCSCWGLETLNDMAQCCGYRLSWIRNLLFYLDIQPIIMQSIILCSVLFHFWVGRNQRYRSQWGKFNIGTKWSERIERQDNPFVYNFCPIAVSCFSLYINPGKSAVPVWSIDVVDLNSLTRVNDNNSAFPVK